MTMEEIREMIRDACEDLGYPWEPDEIEIKINHRLKTSAGRAHWARADVNASRKPDRIEINPTALEEHTHEENIDTIRHEVAHLTTRAKDNDPVFKQFCRRHDIPTHYAQALSTAPYQVWCTKCQAAGRRYSRLGRRLKRIQNHPEQFTCRGCESEGTLEIRDVGNPGHIIEVAQMEGRQEGNTFYIAREDKFMLQKREFDAEEIDGQMVVFDPDKGEHGALVRRRFRRTKEPKGKDC